MLKICKENKQSILEKVKNGHLDTASLCSKNLIDEIILAMYTNDILSYICKSIPDKRAHNKTIVCDYFPVDKIEDGVYNKNESRDAFNKDAA